jgi:hypothetical protein
MVDNVMDNGGYPVNRDRTTLSMIERAMRLGCKVSDRVRNEGCGVAEQLLFDPASSPRTKSIALRLLLTAEKMNAEITMKLLEMQAESRAEQQEQTPEMHGVARELAKQLQRNPDYMKFLRKQAAEHTIDADSAPSDNGNGRASE